MTKTRIITACLLSVALLVIDATNNIRSIDPCSAIMMSTTSRTKRESFDPASLSNEREQKRARRTTGVLWQEFDQQEEKEREQQQPSLRFSREGEEDGRKLDSTDKAMDWGQLSPRASTTSTPAPQMMMMNNNASSKKKKNAQDGILLPPRIIDPSAAAREMCGVMQRDFQNEEPVRIFGTATTKKLVAHDPSLSNKFEWAERYFNKLMQEGHINSHPAKIKSRMQQNCGTEPIPEECVIQKWIATKRREICSKCPTEYLWARAYFNKLMDEGYITASANEIHARILENCGTEPVPHKGSVKRWLAAERKKDADHCDGRDLRWARCFFDNLMKEQRHVKSSRKQIYGLMQLKCGTETLPALATLGMWLAEHRKKVGVSRPLVLPTYTWATNYFNKLMEQGHVNSLPAQVWNLMLENCGMEPIPEESTVGTWLSIKRKQVYTSLPYKREYAWAHEYFDKLMEEGHICSTSPQIWKLMKQNCGMNLVPEIGTVAAWLVAKRKEFDTKSPTTYYNEEWAHSYFNKLMAAGQINSSAKHIHTIIVQNSKFAPSPSEEDIGQWLVAKRKEVGRRCGEEYLWARCYFNELMETGYIDSSKTIIHRLMKQNSPDEPVPTEDIVGHWLGAAYARKIHK